MSTPRGIPKGYGMRPEFRIDNEQETVAKCESLKNLYTKALELFESPDLINADTELQQAWPVEKEDSLPHSSEVSLSQQTIIYEKTLAIIQILIKLGVEDINSSIKADVNNLTSNVKFSDFEKKLSTRESVLPLSLTPQFGEHFILNEKKADIALAITDLENFKRYLTEPS